MAAQRLLLDPATALESAIQLRPALLHAVSAAVDGMVINSPSRDAQRHAASALTDLLAFAPHLHGCIPAISFIFSSNRYR